MANEVTVYPIHDDGTHKAATAFDVAHLAGVSQATVSRVFNNDKLVQPATRQRVMNAARKLHYRPNAIARSLTMRHTNIIGIVMGDITNPFYPGVLERFLDKLQLEGRQVLLFNAHKNKEIDDIMPQVLQYRVDGLIIASATLSTKMADECADLGIPVILFNRYGARSSSASAVVCDNVAAGQHVADLFAGAGFERVAYIAGRENTSNSRDREKGFSERLKEHGISMWREQGDYSYHSAREATVRLFRAHPDTQALFCVTDLMSFGAMDAIRYDLHLRVPEDVSVIGFGDSQMAAWPTYALTTIAHPIDAMIDTTIQLLDAQIESEHTTQTIKVLHGELIRRQSAKLPA